MEKLTPELYDEIEEMWKRCKDNIESNMECLLSNINRI